jgi:ABC-2 type transport system permease protein
LTRIRLLLGKDLRTLGRSPFLVAALVVYPLLVAALVGLAVRYADERPSVAFVDLDGLPEAIAVGGREFDLEEVFDRVDDEVEIVTLDEDEAADRLADGRVVAVVTVPPGFVSTLRGLVRSPTLRLEVGRSGLSGRAELEMQALVYQLNRTLQEEYVASNLDYIELLVEGGRGNFVGNEFDVIGLERAAGMLDDLERRTTDPEALDEIRDLQVFIREVRLAVDQTGSALRSVANPIELETVESEGRTWLLSAQVQAYALALTLSFVCILLAAAAIAAERDENTLGRLARGLVRLRELVAEKVAFAALVGAALALALALVFGIVAEAAGLTGGEPWERLPLLAAGLLLAAAAFGAFGVLVGAVAKEARTAALVGFLVALPLVLVGMLPEGTSVVTDWVSNLFPLVHGVRLFEASLYDSDPWDRVAREAAWLAGLGAAYWAAARIGVRRLL